jgi:hypothetical protein
VGCIYGRYDDDDHDDLRTALWDVFTDGTSSVYDMYLWDVFTDGTPKASTSEIMMINDSDFRFMNHDVNVVNDDQYH